MSKIKRWASLLTTYRPSPSNARFWTQLLILGGRWSPTTFLKVTNFLSFTI